MCPLEGYFVFTNYSPYRKVPMLDEEIIDLYLNGMSINEICRKYHKSARKIKKVLKLNNIKIISQPNQPTFEQVKQFFINLGYTLLSKEYINNRTKLEYICPRGHNGESIFAHFKTYKGCCFKCCYENQKLDKDFVFKSIENTGYKVISKEYKCAKEKLDLNCPCGHVIKMSWECFKRRHIKDNQICRKCMKGEKHPSWNPNITMEERIGNRKIIDNKIFRISVYKRDNYTCQKCNKSKCNLNAHHLNSFHWDKINRFNIDNGITLCKNCHKEFHSIYGMKNNTKEQYIQWNLKT